MRSGDGKRRAVRKGSRRFLGAVYAAALLLALAIFWGTGLSAQARETGQQTGQGQETAQTGEELLDQMDFSEMEKVFRELFPEERLTFGEMLRSVMSGEETLTASLVNRMVKDQLFYAFRVGRQSLIRLIGVALGAALFLSLSGMFRSRQVSEISFFLLYMLLVGICLASFQAASDWVEEGIGGLTGFMKALYPLYFLAVTAAKGSASAQVFYHLALLLIFLVEELVRKLLLPVIHVYVMVRVLNSLQTEDYLSKFAELLELAVRWGLQSILGCMIGLNVIQGLVAPVIDSLKRSVVTRGLEALPGIGDALGGTAEVVVGTAALIKNSIGLTGAVICCALCLSPLIQLAALTFLYKLAAALVQPVTDARMVECISGVGEGLRLLTRAVFVCGALFLLTIAIVAYTTGTG